MARASPFQKVAKELTKFWGSANDESAARPEGSKKLAHYEQPQQTTETY
jgi:hypothetical protein